MLKKFSLKLLKTVYVKLGLNNRVTFVEIMQVI